MPYKREPASAAIEQERRGDESEEHRCCMLSALPDHVRQVPCNERQLTWLCEWCRQEGRRAHVSGEGALTVHAW